ncbi:MAG: hypothetical protein D3922_11495, partial [Candidatus Electrothrix sp. AR1]|nr:hypothetical protein [Candidatus Electrothrix sp. AR1]
RDGALFLFGEDGLPDRTFGDMGVLVTDDENDTVFYDVLVTEEMIAATGVTVGEAGMREALLITYAKGEGANSEQLFQQQVAGASADAADEGSEETGTVAQIVTTEVDNEEDYAFSLAAIDAGSVVVVGASGAQDIASAAVRKYNVLQASVSGSSWSSTTGDTSVLTGQAQDVTRTTALIPGEILSKLGKVTERGVVFSIDPLPVLKGGDTTTADSTTKDAKTTDGSTTTGSTTTGGSTTSTTAGTTKEEGDTTPPTITSTTSSTFAVTDEVIITVTTNEEAYCGYRKDYSTSVAGYDDMVTTDGIAHKINLGDALTIASHTYYVGCYDESDNVTKFPTEIQFVVTPVIISNGDFSSGILSVTTDVDASCGYNDGSDVAYDLMTKFVTTRTTDHSSSISLTTGDYTYYVRCQDISSGEETPVGTAISFTVASITQPDDQTTALFASSSPMKAGLSTALESVGSLFVSTAIAQDNTGTTSTTTTSTANNTDTNNQT